MSVKKVARAITAPADSNVRMHYAKVTATTPLTVIIGNDPNSSIANIKQLLTYYSPTVNDVVVVVFIGNDPFVLGRLV